MLRLAIITVCAISAVLASAAWAGQPPTQTLNPPPPDYLICKAIGTGTICDGKRQFVKDEEKQDELICGSGSGAFNIYDNGTVDQHATRWYDADGNLTRRIIHERWAPAWWSNPLSGKTVPYTQTNKITTELAVPGDFASATETVVGENIYTDPLTHEKVLRSTGRTVFGTDGLEFSSGKQPFIAAFVDGDMSVFDAVCAALSS